MRRTSKERRTLILAQALAALDMLAGSTGAAAALDALKSS
jgi:hypothetical protein